MALKIGVSLESGIAVEDAYARIFHIEGDKSTLAIALQYYVSQAAVEEQKPPFKEDYYQFVPSVEDDAPNFIKQGYEHLKSLPEFADAVDVLE